MTLSKERKYILIAGALLLVVALVYRYSPALDGFSMPSDGIAATEEKLASYRRMAKKRQAQEERLKLLKASLAKAEVGLLRGKTEALAAVEVQNVMRQIVAKEGGKLRSMRVLTPKGEEDGAYLGIPVEATIQATIRELKDVLFKIETTQTLVNIREVRIRTVRQKNRKDQLQATLTLAGFSKR